MTEIRYVNGSLTGKKYKPGMVFDFDLAIPCVEVGEFALLVEHDGLNDANVQSMRKLADEGKAPYCVNIGVNPGALPMPDGSMRPMRMNSYDLFDSEYGDFIVYELIPYIAHTYSIRFADSPDMHYVSGGSSGGISAFVIAWFHPDYFHRVYMSSPSFLAMGRGNEVPYLVRKYETKPLRVYEECSEFEPNEYFGWSCPIDDEARETLQFSGYDFACVSFPGEGHISRYRDEDEAYKRNEWIWRNWQTEPIVAKGNSKRVDCVIPRSGKWEPCETFPQNKADVPAPLSEAFRHAVLSNDGLAWYAANENEDLVYLCPNDGVFSPASRLTHAMLHTISRIEPKGAIDMAVDREDRLYVLTAIGVQCVRSFGLIDVILDLPDRSKPLGIAVTDALYVRTETGVYRRELCAECVTGEGGQRKHTGYYD